MFESGEGTSDFMSFHELEGNYTKLQDKGKIEPNWIDLKNKAIYRYWEIRGEYDLTCAKINCYRLADLKEKIFTSE